LDGNAHTSRVTTGAPTEETEEELKLQYDALISSLPQELLGRNGSRISEEELVDATVRYIQSLENRISQLKVETAVMKARRILPNRCAEEVSFF
jgi:uncharacterized protein YbcI